MIVDETREEKARMRIMMRRSERMVMMMLMIMMIMIMMIMIMMIMIMKLMIMIFMMSMTMLPFQTFRNWINSLGFDPYVNDLYDGLCDGLIILQVI